MSSALPVGIQIVNEHLASDLREQGLLQPPNQLGYIHLAGEIDPPRPFKWRSTRKKDFLVRFKVAVEVLKTDHHDRVARADVFDAVLVPPGARREALQDLKRWGLNQHIANFDVVLLVECSSVEAAKDVRKSKAFKTCQGLLEEAASYVHCITAQNVKRIAEVDKGSSGIFLFNYFVADSHEETGVSGAEMMNAVWEFTAGWWTANVNLTNSTPLGPIEGEFSEYTLINHCRWDRWIDVLPQLAFSRELRTFVLANFRANRIVAMPILYRLA